MYPRPQRNLGCHNSVWHHMLYIRFLQLSLCLLHKFLEGMASGKCLQEDSSIPQDMCCQLSLQSLDNNHPLGSLHKNLEESSHFLCQACKALQITLQKCNNSQLDKVLHHLWWHRQELGMLSPHNRCIPHHNLHNTYQGSCWKILNHLSGLTMCMRHQLCQKLCLMLITRKGNRNQIA